MLSTRSKGLLAAGLTALCWSFLAILLKVVVVIADAYTIAWYRMFVAFLVTGIILKYSQGRHAFAVLKEPPGGLLIASLCLAFNYLGFTKCIELTSPSIAQIFIQTGPMMLALTGIVVFREKLTLIQVLGLVVCGSGFGLFFREKLSLAANDVENFTLGLIWVFGAALTWAIFAALQKHLLKFWRPMEINFYVFLTSTICFFPLVNWLEITTMPLWGHLLLVFLGFNTLLAYGSLSLALKFLPASQVSPIIILNPLGTLVLLYLLEQTSWQLIPVDPMTSVGYLGAILAIVGVIFIVTQPRTSARRP